jgi:hypothetical protein
MRCFKPTSYHSDHVVAKCKSIGDTLELKYFIKLLFAALILPLFLLLSGCFWQELLCEVAMDNNSDVYQMQHNECRAINNPAIRGELINS